MSFCSESIPEAIFKSPLVSELILDRNSGSEPILQSVQKITVIVITMGRNQPSPTSLHIIDVIAVEAGSILVNFMANSVPQTLGELSYKCRGKFPIFREDMSTRGVSVWPKDRILKRLLLFCGFKEHHLLRQLEWVPKWLMFFIFNVIDLLNKESLQSFRSILVEETVVYFRGKVSWLVFLHRFLG